MLLPPHKVTDIAREMLQLLQQSELIETDVPREVQLDLEAVLNQYIKTEQELITRTRQTLESRGLTNKDFGRVLQSLADQKGVKVGDEAMDYLLEQLLAMVLSSTNIEEIYGEDHEIRRQLRIPLRKLTEQREKVDKEVRSQVRPVEEGSPVWEIEYNRMMEDIRRRRGL
jgi:uncharacterized protein